MARLAESRRTLGKIREAENTLWRFLGWLSFVVERFAPYIAALLLSGAFAVAMYKARYRPLWFDEFLSVFAAKLPDLSTMRAFAKTAADRQPPLYYLLLHASIRLFGNDAWGIRAPSAVAYVASCVCLYRFVTRQTSRVYGLLAMTLAGITGCWYYATEGRPYALVLACTSAACLCWQSIAMDRRRRVAIAGLGLLLLAAFSIHYSSILLAVAFGVAELFRSVRRRRVDPQIWISLIVPSLLLIPYLPIMRAARENAGVNTSLVASPAWFASLARFTDEFVGPTLTALFTVACLYMAFQIAVHTRRLRNDEPTSTSPIEPPDMAIVTLVLSWGLPIIGIAFGKFVTHQFYPRYVIGAMFGVIVLMTLIVWFGFMRRKEMAVIVWLVICVLFAHTAVYEMRFALRERAHPLQARIRTYIPALVRSDELPIVAPNSFMEVYYYSDPAIRRRIRFVTSERTALRLEGRTDIERAMILSAPYFRTPVVNYDEFVRKYPNFYIIGGPRWIVPRLIEEGAHLELVKGGAGDNPTEDINYIFRVNMPSR